MLSLWNMDNTKTKKWYQIPLDGCVSSTGKQYRITVKKGTTNKLLVNFVGGGFSWNEETAANPLTIGAMLKRKNGFYISDLSPVLLNLGHVGLLKATDKRSPFHDWYIMNIPYTSGDFHTGNNEFPYKNAKGESKVLYHHGQKNVASALAVLKDFFCQTPDVLMIMGQSAGGAGCVAHCPQIQSLYPECNHVIVYSEGTHFHSSLYPNIVKNVWRANPDLIAYIESEDLMADLFRYAQDNMPSSTQFLHSNSVWDGMLTKYMNKMIHNDFSIHPQALQEFNDTLLQTTRKLKKEISNYSYYLTDYGKKQKDGTTPHIFAATPKLLYSEMQDGMSVANWLYRAIEGTPMDVGVKFVENIL